LSFGNPGLRNFIKWERATLKGFTALRNPFRIATRLTTHLHFPGLPKLNPGLKLANTFGVSHGGNEKIETEATLFGLQSLASFGKVV
jgi:hypothetical protein